MNIASQGVDAALNIGHHLISTTLNQKCIKIVSNSTMLIKLAFAYFSVGSVGVSIIR